MERPLTSGGEWSAPTCGGPGVRGSPGRLTPFLQQSHVCGAPTLGFQGGKKGHIRVPVGLQGQDSLLNDLKMRVTGISQVRWRENTGVWLMCLCPVLPNAPECWGFCKPHLRTRKHLYSISRHVRPSATFVTVTS